MLTQVPGPPSRLDTAVLGPLNQLTWGREHIDLQHDCTDVDATMHRARDACLRIPSGTIDLQLRPFVSLNVQGPPGIRSKLVFPQPLS